MAGSITTNGLPSDAPEYGGDNTNSTIEVDAKRIRVLLLGMDGQNIHPGMIDA